MSRLAAPFAVRSFRFQWPADLLISWAFEMETLILGWYVLVETGSVAFLTVFAAVQYGGTLVAPFIGVAGDRIGHRNLVLGMRVIYALVASTLMLLALSGALTPLLACVLAATTGMVRPADLGMRGALIAESMPYDLLTGAMGISRSTSDSARVAGALAGAGLFAVFGIGAAYVVITAFYVCGALLMLGVERSTRALTIGRAFPQPSAWRDLREGLGHIWHTPRLLAVIWLAFLVNMLAYPVTQGFLPYVAREVYRVDETGLGYLVASFAFGALVGSIVLGRLGSTRYLGRLMIVGAVVWFCLLLLFAQMESLRSGIITLLLAGFAQSIAMVSHTVILLQEAKPHIRGRVMGVRMLAVYNLPMGILAMGALIAQVGFRPTASLYAIVALVLVGLTAWHWRGTLLRSQAADQAERV